MVELDKEWREYERSFAGRVDISAARMQLLREQVATLIRNRQRRHSETMLALAVALVGLLLSLVAVVMALV